MTVGGIDGCKYGWVLIEYDNDGYQFGGIYQSIAELVASHHNIQSYLIDIPVGLSSKGCTRTIEQSLRQELGKRASTVFNAPTRESLKANTYEEAKAINLKIEGKSLSKQTFNISPKIAEVDLLLTSTPCFKEMLTESHPELCFKLLKNNKVVMSKKSTKEGIQERLNLLSHYEPALIGLYDNVLKRTLRKDVKRDDIIDAICLCLSNKLAHEEGFNYISDDVKIDQNNINIRIATPRLIKG